MYAVSTETCAQVGGGYVVLPAQNFRDSLAHFSCLQNVYFWASFSCLDCGWHPPFLQLVSSFTCFTAHVTSLPPHHVTHTFCSYRNWASWFDCQKTHCADLSTPGHAYAQWRAPLTATRYPSFTC